MNGVAIVDITRRVGTPSVRDLLAHVVYPPSPEKLDRVARMYQETDARLIGFERDSSLIGGVGFERDGLDQIVIRHIAVAPGACLRGVGRQMVAWLAALDGVGRLTAETDRDAVEFYRRCDFEITSLGELYPGTERFRCDLDTRSTIPCHPDRSELASGAEGSRCLSR